VLVPRNTPIRRRPQRPTLCATASVNPSCRSPNCASRLLRQSYCFNAAGSCSASTPLTSPVQVSMAAVSNVQGARPPRWARNDSSVAARPCPMQLVAVNFFSSSSVIALSKNSWDGALGTGGRVVQNRGDGAALDRVVQQVRPRPRPELQRRRVRQGGERLDRDQAAIPDGARVDGRALGRNGVSKYQLTRARKKNNRAHCLSGS